MSSPRHIQYMKAMLCSVIWIAERSAVHLQNYLLSSQSNKALHVENNISMQERQRAEDDRRAVAAARADAERERLSRERLEQQVTGHHSRVDAAPSGFG